MELIRLSNEPVYVSTSANGVRINLYSRGLVKKKKGSFICFIIEQLSKYREFISIYLKTFIIKHVLLVQWDYSFNRAINRVFIDFIQVPLGWEI